MASPHPARKPATAGGSDATSYNLI